MADKPRNTVTIGDIVVSTDKETNEPKKDDNGCTFYHLKVWLPDDVSEVTLKKGDFLNFRQLTDKEIEDMPNWKKEIAQLKCWVKVNK